MTTRRVVCLVIIGNTLGVAAYLLTHRQSRPEPEPVYLTRKPPTAECNIGEVWAFTGQDGPEGPPFKCVAVEDVWHPVQHRLTQWEHGWETMLVRATRYTNPTIGYSIGFEFPKHPHQSDRAELAHYLEAPERGGLVYQGGGYPGAPLLVVFKDVDDRESADKKINAILPGLSKLMEQLSEER